MNNYRIDSFNDKYLPPGEAREKTLQKHFKDFPWLWAVSPDWYGSGNMVLGVYLATRELLVEKRQVRPLGRLSDLEVWLKLRRARTCGQFVQKIPLKRQKCERGIIADEITLAGIVYRELSLRSWGVSSPMVEVQFIVTVEKGNFPKAYLDIPNNTSSFVEYVVYEPPQGEKNFNRFCQEVVTEQYIHG